MKNYSKEIPKINKTCQLCNKEFLGIRKSRVFCSKLCVNKKYYLNKVKVGRLKLGIYKDCSFCGKSIYLSPSKSKQNKTYCKGCKYKDSFNFPCKICSKPIYTQPAQLKYRARSTCSPECRSELRRRRTIENRDYSKITKRQIDRAERGSKKANDWRKSVFERDNYTCQFCGIRGTYLEADHIKPWAYFPELRYELSNGRTLCKPCHNTTKIGYHKMREIYGIQN